MALQKRISRRSLFTLGVAVGAAALAAGARGKAGESWFAASELTPSSGHTGKPGCACPMCKTSGPAPVRLA